MQFVFQPQPVGHRTNCVSFFSFQVEPIGNGRLSFILEMMTLFRPCRDKVNKLLKSRLEMTYLTRWGL